MEIEIEIEKQSLKSATPRPVKVSSPLAFTLNSLKSNVYSIIIYLHPTKVSKKFHFISST